MNLAIHCYVYPTDRGIRLDQLSCLESLRICLGQIARFPSEGLNPDTIEDLTVVIPQSSRLKHLHLSLLSGSHNRTRLYTQMKTDALELLGPLVPQLESLTLEGDLHLSAKALQSWSRPLQNLRSLSLGGMSLIDQISKNIPDHMPLLQTLELSAFQSLQEKCTFDFEPDEHQVKPLLSSPQLKNLSFIGFPTAILWDALESNGPSLKSIRFHIREDEDALCLRRGPDLSKLLLTTWYLHRMSSKCCALRSITLDVGRSDIPYDEDLIQADIKPSNPLYAITLMPQLQHLHIFLLNDAFGVRSPDPTTEDVLITYNSIRRLKQGCSLQNLLICWGQQRWEVWDSGPGRMVSMLYKSGRGGGEWLRETWDLDRSPIARIEVRVEGREETVSSLRGEWCITPGWG